MALDHGHPPEDEEDESESNSYSPVRKRRKKRKGKKKKAKKKSRHDDSEVGCQSCDSIESSPTRYKDDMTWTGYKIKQRRRTEFSREDQKSD